MSITRRQFGAAAAGAFASPAAQALVQFGVQQNAAIVVPNDPSRAARDAASEIQTALKRITSVEFPIRNERQGGGVQENLIVIGAGRLAAEAGIDPKRMEPESFRILTRPGRLYIAGADRNAQDRGTYFGACDFLERELGVRWLWPGDLGTVMPKQSNIELGAIDRTVAPALHLRNLRDARTGRPRHAKGDEYFGVDPAKTEAAAQQSREWLSHQRIGSNAVANYGHAFGNWWERFHKDHPDYFAMMPDGSRVYPWDSYDRCKICVSNPAVLQQWLEDAREYFRRNPEAISYSATPNDNGFHGHCVCPNCESWDDPRGEVYQMTWRIDGKDIKKPHVSVSDRYFHFYNLAADLIAKEFPGKLLGGYAYTGWENPPLRERKLRNNLMVGFVGIEEVYISQAGMARERGKWDEWSTMASKLFYRPNVLHMGHGMPFLYIHRLAEDLKHRYEHAMMGCDYDSLLHHWSTQGLTYYVLAKLLWNPKQDVDAIIADYCRHAFGPAAETMKSYFADVERNTEAFARQYQKIEGDRLQMFRSLPGAFPEPSLQQWREKLKHALALTPADSDHARRIQWVTEGVEYASLTARLMEGGPARMQISAKRDRWMKTHLYDWSLLASDLYWRENRELFPRTAGAI